MATIDVVRVNENPHETVFGIRADTTTRGVDLEGAQITATYADGTSETITWQALDPYTNGGATGAHIDMFHGNSWHELTTTKLLTSLKIDLQPASSVFDTTTNPDDDPLGGSTYGSKVGFPFGLAPELEDMAGDLTATYSGIVNLTGQPAVGDLYTTMVVDFSGLPDGGLLGDLRWNSDIDTMEDAGDLVPWNDAGTVITGTPDVDVLHGGYGNDTIDGLANDDSIIGGEGDDSIKGGQGDDTLTGGAGNDTFVFKSGDGHDTIADFGAGSTDTDDGDAQNNDFINLAAFYTNSAELKADLADDGILNQSDDSDYSNDALLGGSITGLSGLSGMSAKSIKEQTGVKCFARGTLITTDQGDVPVEMLKPGDRVLTQNYEFAELELCISRTIEHQELQQNEKLYPVRIKAGAMGLGLPERDLLVSRQHRMVAMSAIAQRMFGCSNVLVAAIRLTEMPEIYVDTSVKSVEYFHLIFEKHEVIFSEGAPTESFLMNATACKSLDRALWNEFVLIFPEAAEQGFSATPACVIPTPGQQKNMISRHAKNSKELLCV